MEQYILEKTIWTEKDFEQMGWHDCSVYGLAFQPVNAISTDIIFDIDYIFEWIRPIAPKQNFSFWVAPCSLAFTDAFALTIDIDRRGGTTGILEIADLYLIDKVEQEADKWIYEWSIELQEGKINFKSSGFSQVVRQAPILTESQTLTLEERKGIGFS